MLTKDENGSPYQKFMSTTNVYQSAFEAFGTSGAPHEGFTEYIERLSTDDCGLAGYDKGRNASYAGLHGLLLRLQQPGGIYSAVDGVLEQRRVEAGFLHDIGQHVCVSNIKTLRKVSRKDSFMYGLKPVLLSGELGREQGRTGI
jgi:hypothetical protein